MCVYPMKKTLLIIAICFTTICLTAGGIYLWGAYKYSSTYPPNTYINNINVSGYTPENVIKYFQDQTSIHTLTFIGKNNKIVTKTFQQLHITNPSDNCTEPLDGKYWFKHLFTSSQTVNIPHYQWDDNTALTICEEIIAEFGEEIFPQNAYLIRLNDGIYEIIPETEGTHINRVNLYSAIHSAIRNHSQNINLITENCYTLPTVWKDDERMNELMNEANEFIKMKIIFQLTDDTSIEVPQKFLIDISEIKDGNFVVDKEKILEWVNGWVDEWNTVGTTRTFKTSKETTISISPGWRDSYKGWEANKENLYNQLIQVLDNRQVDNTINVKWNSKGVTLFEPDNDFGNTYIEISIDNQHMWFYKNGELILDTPVVTGCVKDGHSSPRGMFKVLGTATDYTMHGSFGTAFCQYMIRTTWSGILIHDAHWRSHYGGKIYLTNGSHGCINTPLKAMIQLYNEVVDYPNILPIIVW